MPRCLAVLQSLEAWTFNLNGIVAVSIIGVSISGMSKSLFVTGTDRTLALAGLRARMADGTDGEPASWRRRSGDLAQITSGANCTVVNSQQNRLARIAIAERAEHVGTRSTLCTPQTRACRCNPGTRIPQSLQRHVMPFYEKGRHRCRSCTRCPILRHATVRYTLRDAAGKHLPGIVASWARCRRNLDRDRNPAILARVHAASCLLASNRVAVLWQSTVGTNGNPRFSQAASIEGI